MKTSIASELRYHVRLFCNYRLAWAYAPWKSSTGIKVGIVGNCYSCGWRGWRGFLVLLLKKKKNQSFSFLIVLLSHDNLLKIYYLWRTIMAGNFSLLEDVDHRQVGVLKSYATLNLKKQKTQTRIQLLIKFRCRFEAYLFWYIQTEFFLSRSDADTTWI